MRSFLDFVPAGGHISYAGAPPPAKGPAWHYEGWNGRFKRSEFARQTMGEPFEYIDPFNGPTTTKTPVVVVGSSLRQVTKRRMFFCSPALGKNRRLQVCVSVNGGG